MELSRLLDTKDSQDHICKADAASWSPPRIAVRLFANQSISVADALDEASDGYFDFTEDDYDVPENERYYHDLCKTFDEFNITFPDSQSMVTMIGGEICNYVINMIVFSAMHIYE